MTCRAIEQMKKAVEEQPRKQAYILITRQWKSFSRRRRHQGDN